ncbi:hypothetical protein [Methylacidimicrobium sp. B4]|uniref:hypothetical protein n=1 Tax=Methylacidimicrobium sp. B4 TaxID=2796139 RepID=UPI001A8D49DD|nr:hypothetical protein [Methylacidimicrobium sp. B4]QSR85166.1 hypothetical protein MacB4_02575 [Methylacidimicrobium sp. B4]
MLTILRNMLKIYMKAQELATIHSTVRTLFPQADILPIPSFPFDVDLCAPIGSIDFLPVPPDCISLDLVSARKYLDYLAAEEFLEGGRRWRALANGGNLEEGSVDLPKVDNDPVVLNRSPITAAPDEIFKEIDLFLGITRKSLLKGVPTEFDLLASRKGEARPKPIAPFSYRKQSPINQSSQFEIGVIRELPPMDGSYAS